MSVNGKASQEKRVKKLQRDAQELISLLKHIDPENMGDKEAIAKAQGLLLNMALQGDFNTNLEALILAGLNRDDVEKLKILFNYSRKIFSAHKLEFKRLSLAIMATVNPQLKKIALEAQLSIAQKELDEAVATGETSDIPLFAQWGIEATAAIVTAVDSDGKTALHHAVEQGDLEAVNWLLKASYRFAMMKDNTGKTPLDYAAKADNYKIFFAIYVGLEQNTYLEQSPYKESARESLRNAGPTIIMMESRRRLNAKYDEFIKKYTQKKQQLPKKINNLFISCLQLISAAEKNAAYHEKFISLCLKLSAKTDRTDDEQLLFDGLLSALKVSALGNSLLRESQDYQYLINRGFVIEKCNQKDIDAHTKKVWADLDVAMSAFDDCLISENMTVEERQEACKAANERLASTKQNNFKAKIEEKSNKKRSAALQMIRGAAMVLFGTLLAPILFLSIPLFSSGKKLFNESKKQYHEACNAEAILKPFENLSHLMLHAMPQNEVEDDKKGLSSLSSTPLKTEIKSKISNIVKATIEKSNAFTAVRLTERYFQNLLDPEHGLPDVARYKWLFEQHITASKYPQCENDIEELYRLLDVLLEQEKATSLLPKDEVLAHKKDIFQHPVEPCSNTSELKTDIKSKVSDIVEATIKKSNASTAKKLIGKYFQNLLERKHGLPDVAGYKWLFEQHITASKYPQCKNDIEELYRLLDVLLEQEKANLLLPENPASVQRKPDDERVVMGEVCQLFEDFREQEKAKLLLPKDQAAVEEKPDNEIVEQKPPILMERGKIASPTMIDEKGKEEATSRHSTDSALSLWERLEASGKAIFSFPSPTITSSNQYSDLLSPSPIPNSYGSGAENRKSTNYSGNQCSFYNSVRLSSPTPNSCANEVRDINSTNYGRPFSATPTIKT